MTEYEFKQKFPGALMTAKQVAECGIAQKALKTMAVALKSADDKVPFGKIGAIAVGDGRKHLYRRHDIAAICCNR